MQKPKLVNVDEAKYFQNTAEPLRFEEPGEMPAWLVGVLSLGFAVAVILWAAVSFGAEAASLPAVPAPSDLTKQLLELASTVLMAALVYAVSAAKSYFAAHAKSSLGQYASGFFSRLSDQALIAVQAVEQMAKRNFESGFTKANAATMKADALSFLKAQIGPQGLATLATIVGLDQVAQVLSTNIEAAVAKVNAAKAASVTASAPAAAAPK